MKTLFLVISILALIVYIVYVLFWRISAVSEGLFKKDYEKAIEKSGQSTNWISWLLLFIVIIFALLFAAV
jgi:hypothetical protein